jgi:hypothetical protein
MMLKVKIYSQEKGGDGRYRWWSDDGYINTAEIGSAQVKYPPDFPTQPVTRVIMTSGAVHLIDGTLVFDESGNLAAYNPGT